MADSHQADISPSAVKTVPHAERRSDTFPVARQEERR